MDYPNDVVSLRRSADIIEVFWGLSPEYRELIRMKIASIEVKRVSCESLESIKRDYLYDLDKLMAIKRVRAFFFNPLTNSTIGLKEAKDLVECWH